MTDDIPPPPYTSRKERNVIDTNQTRSQSYEIQPENIEAQLHRQQQEHNTNLTTGSSGSNTVCSFFKRIYDDTLACCNSIDFWDVSGYIIGIGIVGIIISPFILTCLAISDSESFYNSQNTSESSEYNSTDYERFYYWAVKLPTIGICFWLVPLLPLYYCYSYEKSLKVRFNLSIANVLLGLLLSTAIIGAIMTLVSTGMMTNNLKCSDYGYCEQNFKTYFEISFYMFCVMIFGPVLVFCD